ncbi:MAG TPA: polysaccharide deacetylase family protein [Flavisolibacter sp.]|nr:polysaccharide deacetylase family protein [Flavisolibacter sp.]
METSSDDDGDTAATLTKTSFVLLLLLPALYLSPTKPPGNETFSPPAHESAKKPKPEALASKPKKKKKKLYITFDDGPNRGTKNVLTIVKDENIPVSFFIVGEHVFASRPQAQIWDSLKIAEQIELCNHSYSHAHGRYNRYYEQPDSVVSDFERTHDSLGLDNRIARTPGRNTWRIDTLRFTDLAKTTAAADSLQKAGFVIMGWDLEWHYDHKTMSVTTTADDLIAQIDSLFKHNKTRQPDNLVLLAHDQVYVKADDSLQLRRFLQLLKQKDEYEAALVTAYPGALK